jgi:acyl-CoA synthetase (NDP forming)
VALKVQSPDILHKSDAGAMALNLTEADDIRRAYDDIVSNARVHHPEADIRGVLVQSMAPRGQEIIVGVHRDATFGPMLMVGLGGIYVEVLNDVVFAPVPLGSDEARELLARLKGAALLHGVRGETPADIEALVEVMVSLSHFAADFADDVAEVDLNPVLVHPRGQGISLVDALIVKRTASTERPQSEH